MDGVSGLEGCIFAGSDASGISQVPQVHGGREGVPVQGSLLWTLHRSSGFHQGHGSCVRYSSQDRGAASPLPRRLVTSGLLSGAGSPCSEDSAPALQVVRNSRQLGEVSGDSDSTDGVSGSILGVILDSISFRASPALKRVEKLISIGDVFLSCAKQPVSSWLELLGVLSSMIQLVPGGRLSMRSLQLVLRWHWDHVDQSILVEWAQEVRQDLDWWLDRARLERGVSLEQVSPQLKLWSDASDVGWGAHLDEVVTSGLWAPEEVESSINIRELLAIERALRWFAPQLVGSSVAIFANNSTAIAYPRNQGGTHSPLLNSIAQRILRWAESLPVVISPQFIMGKHNLLADALCRPNQIQGSEWTLKQEVFQDLCKRWPVSIDLFATSLNHRCSIYFSPYHDRNALGMDALLQSWNGWQAYAFPPWPLIPAVLKKLRSSSGVLLTIIAPYWPQRPWFPDSPLGGVSSSCDLPTVHHGEAQFASGCFVSPEPDSGLRMDTETGGLSGSVQEVAGLNQPFCHISKSPMFDIFFTLPRSERSGNGCASSELEWVAGVCLSSLASNSSSSEEAPVVLWGPSNHHSTLLASEALVSGSGGGRTGSSSSVQRSPAPASLPSIPSRGVQAVASCLETIQRFTCARGFSKRVAQQVSLARCPSSRAGYQAKWLVFCRWCRSEGHSVSRPSLSKIADFLFWLRRSRRFGFCSDGLSLHVISCV